METESGLTTHTDFVIDTASIVTREVSSVYDRDTANSDLIRMAVKAFGWEVNRNGFQFKKKVLKRTVVDAFGEKIPMYRTFEGKLVDRNHKMQDTGSRQDEAIGYIESASMKEDGVYFDLWLWKRCITDEEQRQIRDKEVSISMEVDFTDPIVILDGAEVESTPDNRRIKGAIRSMADSATVNGLGIAVLFDGIVPGYASAKVVTTENAVLDVTLDSAEDTVPANKERGSEAAQAESFPLEETNMDLETIKAELEAKVAELAAADEALSAKRLELQTVLDELEALRVQKFNECVVASFDLGKLTADTAGWLLGMLAWSGDCGATCAKLVEVAGAVKNPGTPALDPIEDAPLALAGDECVDGDCGECAGCKKKASLEGASSVNPGCDGPEAVEPEALVPLVEPSNPTNDPEGAAQVESATVTVNIASSEPASFGTAPAITWGIEHL